MAQMEHRSILYLNNASLNKQIDSLYKLTIY